MDILQQRILEIALQLPGYLGYEAKERRRDMDKWTRGQLAAKYGELDTYLARIQKKASLEVIVDLENLDQKLQRLIARMNTALTGYAGWFDAAQIVEDDIDALTQFDATLAGGAPQLQAALDKIAVALRAAPSAAFRADVDDAIGACAELLDNLNARFDEREQFLATGKKPALTILPPRQPGASPLGALERKRQPNAEIAALVNLKLNDAISFGGADYIIAGKITYSSASGSFWAFLLQDGGKKLWLRVGPGNEIAACQETQFRVPSPLPETFAHDNQDFSRIDAGQAQVTVEGAGGIKRGAANYARYTCDAPNRLWLEDFGTESRAMAGSVVDMSEFKIYRR
jgi:hypothetical protein